MIDDVVIEERLRRTFDAIGRRAAVDSAESTALVEALSRPTRKRRPRPLLVAIATIVAICVGSLVVAVARSDSHRTKSGVAVSPTTSRATTHNAWCGAISRNEAIVRGIAYGSVIISAANARAKLVSLAELLHAKNNPLLPTDPQAHLGAHQRFWVVELRPTGRSQGPYTWGIVALDATTGDVVAENQGPETGPGGLVSEPRIEPPYWNALPDHAGECAPQAPAPASASTLPLPPAGDSSASLKATAVAWAHAFLVGSLDDIRALQGPECADNTGTTLPLQVVEQYLRGERSVMATSFGRPLDEITITGVTLRSVTNSSGDALVEYDLPANVVGNDNWVNYAIHDGRWKVSDCHAPIGGSSSSAGGTVTSSVP